ncbi:hypothetical protein ACFHYQ_27340 [Sphaerimonospora cavernae]|uniref:Lipoprotein n=1 Tax=Sphaerimonospora cavernae TaxID=1740611 RepID=A0ABV6UCX3_9ACTN
MKYIKIIPVALALMLATGCGADEPASTFVRQADGGRFDSPEELIKTLNDLGMSCIDPQYSKFKASKSLYIYKGTCWSGSGYIDVYTSVQRILIGDYEGDLHNGGGLPGVRGQNWQVNTRRDYAFAAAVKNALGGQVMKN